MKKLSMLIMIFFLLSGISFAQAGEEVSATVPETLFVNYTNNVLFSPDEPIIEIDGVYYLPISPQFLSGMGQIPRWNSEGTSVEILGKARGKKTVIMDQSDRYLVDYKRPLTVIACDPIEVRIGKGKNLIVSSASHRNRWSEVYYIPLTDDVVAAFNWEYYELGNYGDYLFFYDFDVADKDIFLTYQRKTQAMAKYMTIINKSLDINRAAYYVQLVEKTSQKYDVEDMWIMAIMWQESWYVEDCKYINAVGMMQMLKSTGKSMGVTPEQLLDPAINIDVCVKYLSRDRSYFDGDLEKAIHAYNQGSFRVVKNTHKTWYYEEVAVKYTKINAYIDKKVLGE